MKNEYKILKTGLLSLAVGLAIAACAAGRAAEKTNTPAASKPQNLYQQALANIGKAGEWKDSGKVLPEVVWSNMPVREVVTQLLEEFDHQFDVLLPTEWEISDAVESPDWVAVPITLRLKDVTASEAFNAMNLYLGLHDQPLHWELLMNGRHPTAVLRVVVPATPPPAPKLPEETKRAVFYVGELVGDTKSGGMSMDAIRTTVQAVCVQEFHTAGNVYCHEAAELFVVKGTPDEVALVRETIEALKEKVKVERERKRMDASNKARSKAAETKTGPAESKNP